jgi:mitogen-activated protein kinase 7
MRNLIVQEVRAFRRMVRAPPAQRQGSGPKRQETLPVPSRDELGDMQYDDSKAKVVASPIDEDPAAGLERELLRQ